MAVIITNPRKADASGLQAGLPGESPGFGEPPAWSRTSIPRSRTGVLPINPLLFWAFSALIARRRLRKNFRALRIANLQRFPPPDTTPLIVYLNHPSWWDPLTSIVLAPHLIGHRSFYGPIDAESLKRYGLLSRLGLFPVEIDTPRGAAQFLRAAEAVLRNGDVLGLTPQGRFTDARVRPPLLKPGLERLLARMQRAGRPVTVVPLAIEYTFWDERLPEVLVNVGDPILATSLAVAGGASAASRASAAGWDSAGAAWTRHLEERLARTQDELAALSLLRDESQFEVLLRGGRGEAGFYGMWQRLRRAPPWRSVRPPGKPRTKQGGRK